MTKITVMDNIAKNFIKGDKDNTLRILKEYIDKNYKNKSVFCKKVGISRQSLYRMFNGESVSIQMFFKVVDQIREDSR